MCPSSSPNPGQHLHVSAFLAKPFAGNPTELDNSKPHHDQFSLWGHNGSHCVAMPEGEQNRQQEDQGATTTSSDDDAKTGHSFDFLHLLTSIDQLKKSLQDEEADSGHEEEKSRLPSKTCTTALTSMCISIKESLRQEQENSNDELQVPQPRRSALPKSSSKPVYARIHSENRPWKKKEGKGGASAAACGGTTPAPTATTKKCDITCSLQWQQLHHDEGTHRPTSLIDQWEMNNKNNLQFIDISQILLKSFAVFPIEFLRKFLVTFLSNPIDKN